MLNDFVFLDSQPPRPTCRHMGHCSLSLYLGGCTSCDFLNSTTKDPEVISLAAPGRLSLTRESARRNR